MSSFNTPSCYVVLRKDGKVLFVLRSNTGYMDGHYGLPAGHVEDMESFTIASAREALEEVGVIIDPTKLKHLHTMHRHAGDHIRLDVFFEIDSWNGEVKNMETSKHSKIAWLDLKHLPENVMDYTAYVFKQIEAGKTYSEFGWEKDGS